MKKVIAVCFRCGQQLRGAPGAVGSCPRCGARLRLPEIEAMPTPVPPMPLAAHPVRRKKRGMLSRLAAALCLLLLLVGVGAAAYHLAPYVMAQKEFGNLELGMGRSQVAALYPQWEDPFGQGQLLQMDDPYGLLEQKIGVRCDFSDQGALEQITARYPLQQEGTEGLSQRQLQLIRQELSRQYGEYQTLQNGYRWSRWGIEVQLTLGETAAEMTMEQGEPAQASFLKAPFLQTVDQLDIKIPYSEAGDILPHEVDHVAVGDAPAAWHGHIA